VSLAHRRDLISEDLSVVVDEPEYHEVRLNQGIAHELAGETAAAATAYRDFLAATGGDPQYAEGRRAAQQLLARLDRAAAPAERR